MTIKTRTPSKSAAKPASKASETLTKARKPEAEKVAQAKTADIVDATPAAATAPQAQPTPGAEQPITGRGVFAVRTLGSAVSVEAAFLAEDGNVLRLPAVFPNREYALEQIDELRAIVIKHFDELSGQSGN